MRPKLKTAVRIQIATLVAIVGTMSLSCKPRQPSDSLVASDQSLKQRQANAKMYSSFYEDHNGATSTCDLLSKQEAFHPSVQRLFKAVADVQHKMFWKAAKEGVRSLLAENTDILDFYNNHPKEERKDLDGKFYIARSLVLRAITGEQPDSNTNLIAIPKWSFYYKYGGYYLGRVSHRTLFPLWYRTRATDKQKDLYKSLNDDTSRGIYRDSHITYADLITIMPFLDIRRTEDFDPEIKDSSWNILEGSSVSDHMGEITTSTFWRFKDGLLLERAAEMAEKAKSDYYKDQMVKTLIVKVASSFLIGSALRSIRVIGGGVSVGGGPTANSFFDSVAHIHRNILTLGDATRHAELMEALRQEVENAGIQSFKNVLSNDVIQPIRSYALNNLDAIGSAITGGLESEEAKEEQDILQIQSRKLQIMFQLEDELRKLRSSDNLQSVATALEIGHSSGLVDRTYDKIRSFLRVLAYDRHKEEKSFTTSKGFYFLRNSDYELIQSNIVFAPEPGQSIPEPGKTNLAHATTKFDELESLAIHVCRAEARKAYQELELNKIGGAQAKDAVVAAAKLISVAEDCFRRRLTIRLVKSRLFQRSMTQMETMCGHLKHAYEYAANVCIVGGKCGSVGEGGGPVGVAEGANADKLDSQIVPDVDEKILENIEGESKESQDSK